MAEHLSYQHAVNAIRLLYERDGFKLLAKTPGQVISDEAALDITKARLAALFAFIDEMIFILRYQCHFLTACLTSSEKARAVTYLRLCTGLMSTLWSIRVLSSVGLDVNARTQLRYLYELAILWSRIQIDDEACQEFEVASFEQSNAYWHKYLSRRKSEKYLFEGVQEGRFKWNGALARKELDKIYEMLSLSGHPGFWGLYFETTADFRNSGFTKRDANSASHFTLASALFLTTLPFGVNEISKWPFRAIELFKPSEIDPALSRVSDWNQYSFEIRTMIPKMWLMSLPFTSELAGKKW